MEQEMYPLYPVDAFHAFRVGQFVGMLMKAGFEVRIKTGDHGLYTTEITVVKDDQEWEMAVLPERGQKPHEHIFEKYSTFNDVYHRCVCGVMLEDET